MPVNADLIEYLKAEHDEPIYLYWFDAAYVKIRKGRFIRISALNNIIVVDEMIDRYVSTGELGVEFYLRFDVVVDIMKKYLTNENAELHRQIRKNNRKIAEIKKVQNDTDGR